MSPIRKLIALIVLSPTVAFGAPTAELYRPKMKTASERVASDSSTRVARPKVQNGPETDPKVRAMDRAKVGDPALFGHRGDPIFQVYGTDAQPGQYAARTSLSQLTRFVQSSNGDNRSFVGGNTMYVEARDRDDVTSLSKGVLYPIYATISPKFARNNVPFDDANGISVMNVTGVKGASGTDAFYLAHNDFAFGNTMTGSREWLTGITLDANLGLGIQVTGRIDTYGLDLGRAHIVTGKAIRLGNGQGIYSRLAGSDSDMLMMGLNSGNVVEIGKSDAPSVVAIFSQTARVAAVDNRGMSLASGTTLSIGGKVALSGYSDSSIDLGTPKEPIGKAYIASTISSVKIVEQGSEVFLKSGFAIVVIRKSIPAPTKIILPISDPGTTITIKDGLGDASKNAITISPISGTIDGSRSYVISGDRGWVNLSYDGKEWVVH